MKPRLRLVLPDGRPLANLSRAEKLAQAIAYLQRRGLYIMDRNTPRPKWGTPNEVPKEDGALLAAIMEADRRRK